MWAAKLSRKLKINTKNSRNTKTKLPIACRQSGKGRKPKTVLAIINKSTFLYYDFFGGDEKGVSDTRRLDSWRLSLFAVGAEKPLVAQFRFRVTRERTL